MSKIRVHARGDPGAKLSLASDGGDLESKLSLSSGAVRMTDSPSYLGEYEVTPTMQDQELPMGGMRMEGNLTVLGIPCAVVSNEEGGLTVSIAS